MDLSKLPKYSEAYEPVKRNRIVLESPLESLVERAVEVFLSNPSAPQETMLKALEKMGIDPGESYRLYQFIPIAFIHVVFQGSGIAFPQCYDTHNYSTGARTHNLLTDELIYIFANRAAERRVAAGKSLQELFPVFSHSAEWNCIHLLRTRNVELADIVLTPPLLPDYEPDSDEEIPTRS